MIVFDLRCSNGHIFEGWFKDTQEVEERVSKGLIRCPHCGDTQVKKILSPVKLARNPRGVQISDPPEKIAMNLLLKSIHQFVEKHFEDVGDRFAAEALKIHYGITEPKNIRGRATAEEEEVLREEGVNFFKLPEPEPVPRVSLN